jgi:hypothetical protein
MEAETLVGMEEMVAGAMDRISIFRSLNGKIVQ